MGSAGEFGSGDEEGYELRIRPTSVHYFNEGSIWIKVACMHYYWCRNDQQLSALEMHGGAGRL
jgi:hypothetical protein